MEYRTLGRSGLKVAPICLGTMQFGWTADEQTSHRILYAYAEAGANFIDTADEQLDDILGTLNVQLTPDEVQAIDAASDWKQNE